MRKPLTCGDMHENRKDYDAAVKDYDQAIKLVPTNATYLVNRGDTWFRTQQDANAWTDVNQALKIDPNNVSAANLRNSLRNRQQSHTAGVVAGAEPNSAEGCYQRGLQRLKARQIDAALADFNRAIELDPKNARAYAEAAGSIPGITNVAITASMISPRPLS